MKSNPFFYSKFYLLSTYSVQFYYNSIIHYYDVLRNYKHMSYASIRSSIIYLVPHPQGRDGSYCKGNRGRNPCDWRRVQNSNLLKNQDPHQHTDMLFRKYFILAVKTIYGFLFRLHTHLTKQRICYFSTSKYLIIYGDKWNEPFLSRMTGLP